MRREKGARIPVGDFAGVFGVECRGIEAGEPADTAFTLKDGIPEGLFSDTDGGDGADASDNGAASVC